MTTQQWKQIEALKAILPTMDLDLVYAVKAKSVQTEFGCNMVCLASAELRRRGHIVGN